MSLGELWPNDARCLVICHVDDIDEAADFYTKLFGWYVATEPVGQGYHLAWMAGEPLAAIGVKPDGVPSRSNWLTVFPAATAVPPPAKVRAAGGDVLVDRRSLGQLGTVTIAADPVGATFGMASGVAPAVPDSVEVGLPCWSELNTRAVPVAQTFYRALLGFEYAWADDDRGIATALHAGRSPIATVRPCESDLPESVKSAWEPRFSVQNCDRTVELALRLGAVVRSGPRDTPSGRTALIQAPQGENLTLIEHPTTSRRALLSAAGSLGAGAGAGARSDRATDG